MAKAGLAESAEIFWGEISPCEHLVQIYDNEEVFIEPLEAFVTSGLCAGDGVIIIATLAHLEVLEERLIQRGVDLEAARRADQFITMYAEEVLGEFMMGGWPDERKFTSTVLSLIKRARGNDRRVRAFGEMVAVLWGQGHSAATVRLEHLWHALCEAEAFSLFCAYPRSGFTRNINESIEEICKTHTRVLEF